MYKERTTSILGHKADITTRDSLHETGLMVQALNEIH
jgi:hypothetical protein